MKLFKSILLSLLLIFVLIPTQAFAAGKIDIDRKVDYSISYLDEGQPLVGVGFSLYKIANLNEYGEYTLTSEFSVYNVDISVVDEAAWKTLSSTLEGYILRDRVIPTYSQLTDENGLASFDDIDVGLYLVMGDQHEQNDILYEVDTFVIQLPALDKENNEWLYEVTSKPKFRFKEKINYIDIHVIKTWEDKGNEKIRPEQITVQLLRDGQVYDTVILSKENNWRYKWTRLDGDSKWHVVEEEIKNYYVEITNEGYVFVVNNTYDIPPGPPPEVPPTGQLWWPVPVLMISGFIFICFGLFLRKNESNYEI